ncbi:MAG: hypothetical protein Q7K33_01750 [Candidatus Berkelbacteria bacterium]|nr:hypothetical protein [Candidatus Berkelbacteria bacterium]
MIKLVAGLIAVTFLLGLTPVYAHPGRTAADGGHYCRTNCAKWGQVEGARHFHSKPAPKISKATKSSTKSSGKKYSKVKSR